MYWLLGLLALWTVASCVRVFWSQKMYFPRSRVAKYASMVLNTPAALFIVLSAVVYEAWDDYKRKR